MFTTPRGAFLALLLFVSVLSASLSTRAVSAEPLQPRDVPPEVYMDRSGLPELVVQSGASWSFMGFLITMNLFEDRDREDSGIYLGALLGSSLPLALTFDKPITTSQAMSLNFAQRVGWVYSFTLPQLIFGGFEESRKLGALYAITSGAAVILGDQLYDGLRLTPGQLSGLSTGLIAGTVSAAFITEMMDRRFDDKLSASLFLVGSQVGALGAYMLRDYLDISRGRAWALDLGMGVGIGVGAGLTLFVGGSEASDQLLYGLMLAGMYGGMLGAYQLSPLIDSWTGASSGSEDDEWTLNTLTPTLIPSVHPNTGKATLNPGLSLLSGTW